MLRGQVHIAQLYINGLQDYLKLAEQIGKVRAEGSEQNDQSRMIRADQKGYAN